VLEIAAGTGLNFPYVAPNARRVLWPGHQRTPDAGFPDCRSGRRRRHV